MEPLSPACAVCRNNHSSFGACGICAHTENPRAQPSSPDMKLQFSEILTNFLYLGCFNSAMCSALLQDHGISRVLNTVSGHEYCDKDQFSCHSLPEGKLLPFNEAIRFLDRCKKDNDRVLVYCMTGRSRSPAIVLAYLMRSKEMKFREAYAWLKEKVPFVELSPEFVRQLEEFEQKPVEICSVEFEHKTRETVEKEREDFWVEECTRAYLRRNSVGSGSSSTVDVPVLTKRPHPQKQKRSFELVPNPLDSKSPDNDNAFGTWMTQDALLAMSRPRKGIRMFRYIK